MTIIDLNADMGESFGPWTMGDDAALLDIVTSANIACGFHAGDPRVMARSVEMALDRGVAIGAHPGFDDLRGFGRRRLPVEPEGLADIQYQIGALQAVTAARGGAVAHLKLHGALANMTSEDEGLARLCYEAALAVDPDLTVFVLAATAQERAARALGCTFACEAFADRAYNPDGTLVDRARPGAVISDPGEAAQRVVQMVTRGGLLTPEGELIPTRIDTVCLHGDTAGARTIAAAVRAALETAGVALRPATEVAARAAEG